MHSDPVDLVKEFVGYVLAASAFQENAQVVNGPLAAVDIVVFFLHHYTTAY